MDNFCTKICSVDKQWTQVLDNIKDQINPANFRTWFAQTSGQINSEGTLTIKVRHAFIKESLEKRFLTVIQSSVEKVFGSSMPLDFKVDSSLTASNPPKEEAELQFTPNIPSFSHSSLNPKYTLASFVVGLSNNLAYAAAQAVVQNPGISYNPLFIYGGTGVGKTHLMHAIGQALLNKNPYFKIIYCSSEKFMNDLVQGIQTKRTGEFRAKYRACDLLLVDDIQFISGRDSTQEEFFHTFNELQAKNSQIVLTSDRPPNEIQKLESRLASRFQGGLMVDIQQPDFDTRVAILKARCAEKGDLIPGEILTLIAESMPTNARELEGKLLQIIQNTKLMGQVLTEETVRKFLGQPSLSTNGQKLEYKKVLAEINQYFDIKMADITGPRRKKGLVLPRQMAMYLLYKECKLPYERIGDLLGGRDHTTIMHGVEKITEAVSRDREIQRMLIEIKQALQ
ncbi:MAG: Chromosomal replication initiator protein DnaA [Candidatus Daviesbacteria bacterium GW2011_GWA2_40_9]|uniref:Chromosomal replication initiator protein DnaA n=1 Tax=Candidatus Daviesbacteria bacterium GW2011_GWA2_40_9 TaxID=1618424 RepID=A0A0G0X556_9BACT|nr:MAG: Chromosomal replication initiator protein DnaA [Candidatus Daviesbacteria bacterium GW2011_GWC1_40_9]KKR82762.1 MAG: Chromosomal replication initiator protein DnaA [Candidatus Daviesbacteria bacterium GW2011_GWA2_40_9]